MTTATKEPAAPPIWSNRIVGYANVPPSVLMANPLNWRIHSEEQGKVLTSVLQKIGMVQNVVINIETAAWEIAEDPEDAFEDTDQDQDAPPVITFIRTEIDTPTVEYVRITDPVLIDGHYRTTLAKEQNQPYLPVTVVRLSPEEEAEILATFDPISQLATVDSVKLQQVCERFTEEDKLLQSFMAGIASKAGLSISSFTPIEAPSKSPSQSPSRSQSTEKTYTPQKRVTLSFLPENFAVFDAATKRLSEHYSTETLADTLLAAVETAVNAIPEPQEAARRGRKPKAQVNEPPAPQPESQPQEIRSVFSDDDDEEIPELV